MRLFAGPGTGAECDQFVGGRYIEFFRRPNDAMSGKRLLKSVLGLTGSLNRVRR